MSLEPEPQPLGEWGTLFQAQNPCIFMPNPAEGEGRLSQAWHGAETQKSSAPTYHGATRRLVGPAHWVGNGLGTR